MTRRKMEIRGGKWQQKNHVKIIANNRNFAALVYKYKYDTMHTFMHIWCVCQIVLETPRCHFIKLSSQFSVGDLDVYAFAVARKINTGTQLSASSFRAYNHLMLCVAIIIHFRIVFPRTTQKKQQKKHELTQTHVWNVLWQQSAAVYISSAFDVGLNVIFARSVACLASFAARVNILIMFTWCKPKQMDFPFNFCVCVYVHISAKFFFSHLQNSHVYRSLNFHFLCVNYNSREDEGKRKNEKENQATFTNSKICCVFSPCQPTHEILAFPFFVWTIIKPQQFGCSVGIFLTPFKIFTRFNGGDTLFWIISCKNSMDFDLFQFCQRERIKIAKTSYASDVHIPYETQLVSKHFILYLILNVFALYSKPSKHLLHNSQ